MWKAGEWYLHARCFLGWRGNFPLRYLPGSIASMKPFSFPTSIMMDKIHGGNSVIHEAVKKCITEITVFKF